jgi:hypothetical protein
MSHLKENTYEEFTYEEVVSYLEASGYDIRDDDGSVNPILFGEMAANEGFRADPNEERVIFYK